MKRDDNYTWFGIEKPFPWVIIFWPFWWAYFTVVEAYEEHRRNYGK